jgi:putative GTP pyrophosphokinase
MPDDTNTDEILTLVDSKLYLFKTFLKGVETIFLEDPLLKTTPPTVHSIKCRIKDLNHLREKISRKNRESQVITPDNVFEKITDIAGIRVLHLHQNQFTKIHECIMAQIDRGDWVLYENPKAYTWDPESKAFFESYSLDVQVKETFYTSIHYVVKPRIDSELTCEIQVRTLFEEIWGEIDHIINYPTPTESLACREQIKVLARLVGAGSRLNDSIFRTYNESHRVP